MNTQKLYEFQSDKENIKSLYVTRKFTFSGVPTGWIVDECFLIPSSLEGEIYNGKQGRLDNVCDGTQLDIIEKCIFSGLTKCIEWIGYYNEKTKSYERVDVSHLEEEVKQGGKICTRFAYGLIHACLMLLNKFFSLDADELFDDEYEEEDNKPKEVIQPKESLKKLSGPKPRPRKGRKVENLENYLNSIDDEVRVIMDIFVSESDEGTLLNGKKVEVVQLNDKLLGLDLCKKVKNEKIPDNSILLYSRGRFNYYLRAKETYNHTIIAHDNGDGSLDFMYVTSTTFNGKQNGMQFMGNRIHFDNLGLVVVIPETATWAVHTSLVLKDKEEKSIA
jgi:hypothetical protein